MARISKQNPNGSLQASTPPIFMEWHKRDAPWSAELLDWLRQTDPDWVDQAYQTMSQFGSADISGFVDAYLIWHSEPEPETTAVISFIAASNPLDLVERCPWFQAQMASWLGLWQVREALPGEGMFLLDLLTEERRYVVEPTASATWMPDQVFLARVVDLGRGVHVLAGSYPHPLLTAEALAVRQIFLGYLFPRRRRVKPKDLRAGNVFRTLTQFWLCHLQSLHPDVAVVSRPRGEFELTDEELDELTEFMSNRTLVRKDA